LELSGIARGSVTLEQIGRFTGWLRQPADNVIVLVNGPRRSSRTVSRMLSAVFGFMTSTRVTAWRPPGC
jgi:hypothetical protein